MDKTKYALIATIGCVVGFATTIMMFSETFFRTCKNVHKDIGFECSECGSHTDYHPVNPFIFCPMCGAFVMRKKGI